MSAYGYGNQEVKKDQLKVDNKNKTVKIGLDDDELLQCLIKEQQSWYSFFTDALQRAYNVMTFLYIDQWDDNISAQRKIRNKPSMTFNLLVPIIRAILGEARRNSPENKVIGTGKNQNSKDAELRTGILRYIAYHCSADVIYQDALKQMIEIGWGGAIVDICYKKGTFEKYMELIACSDYQSFYWDCSAQATDRSDGDFCGMHNVMGAEDFTRSFQHIENPISVINNLYTTYESRDVVIFCTTWRKEYFNVDLAKLSDGRTVTKKEAKQIIQQREDEIKLALELFAKEARAMKTALKKGEAIEPVIMEEDIPEPLEIVDERSEIDYKIFKIRWVQNAIIDKEEWPGKMLPGVYFNGDSTVIRGERIPLSFIQEAVDSQKLVNYYGSEIALSVLNSRREKSMGTPAMFKGHEDAWRNADNVQGALLYNIDPQAGASGGKPEIISPPVFNESLLSAMQATIAQLKQVLGRPDETQGMESNAIAGVAIGKRQQAANNGVNLYLDNWEKGIETIGKIQLELLPFVYDSEQDIQIKNANGNMDTVTVNKSSDQMIYDENGEPQDQMIENDLSQGDYDVEVSVSGSYDSQQLEKINAFKEFVSMLAQASPQSIQAIIDLVPEMVSLEDSVEVTERLRAIAPPQIKALIDGQDPDKVAQEQQNQVPPEVQMQMQQMELQQKTLDLKQQQIQMEHDAKIKQLEVDEQKIEAQKLQSILEAQAKGVDVKLAIHESQQETQRVAMKSAAEVEKAHLNQGTEHLKHATQRMGHIAKLDQILKKNANQQ